MAAVGRTAQLSQAISSIFDAYDRMEMDARVYLLAVLIPTLALFLGSTVLAVVWQTAFFVRLLLPILGLVFQ